MQACAIGLRRERRKPWLLQKQIWSVRIQVCICITWTRQWHNAVLPIVCFYMWSKPWSQLMRPGTFPLLFVPKRKRPSSHSSKKLYYEGRRRLLPAIHFFNQTDFQQTEKDLLGKKPSIYPLFNLTNKHMNQISGMIQSTCLPNTNFMTNSGKQGPGNDSSFFCASFQNLIDWIRIHKIKYPGRCHSASDWRLSCRAWSWTLTREDSDHAYKRRVHVPWANLSQAWPGTAHHAIHWGSSHPHAEGGNDNPDTRQRADAGLDQEA